MKTVKQFENTATSLINRRRGGQRNNTKKIKKTIKWVEEPKQTIKKHIRKHTKGPKITEKPKVPIIIKIGFSKKNDYMHFDVRVFRNMLCPLVQLEISKLPISDFLRNILKQMHGIKLDISLDITFLKTDNVKEQFSSFKTKAKEITNEHDIDNVISNCNNELLNRISEWESGGSGWIIKAIRMN